MHVGALAIFEGPPPAREECCDHLEARLGRVPRYRQKLAFPPLETGRPFWVDDPHFNLDYHVRHTTLPRPGTTASCARSPAGSCRSSSTARSRSGRCGSSRASRAARFAVITKIHHCLIDGVSGVDLLEVLFDLTPEPAEIEAEAAWAPAPEPSDCELVAETRRLVRTPFEPRRARRSARIDAPETLDDVREAARRARRGRWAGLNPRARPPLNVPIGPHRRCDWLAMSRRRLQGRQERARRDRSTTSCWRWWRERSRSWLPRAAACASRASSCARSCAGDVRSDDERGTLGNRVVAVRRALPVVRGRPGRRLREGSRDAEGA